MSTTRYSQPGQNLQTGLRSAQGLGAVAISTTANNSPLAPINTSQENTNIRAEVDRRVLEKLNNPTNPRNIFQYDLAGEGSVKEKAKVLWNGFLYITGFLILIGLGKLMDEKILHTDSGSFLPYSFFIFAVMWLAIYVSYNRLKLRRDLHRTRQVLEDSGAKDSHDV